MIVFLVGNIGHGDLNMSKPCVRAALLGMLLANSAQADDAVAITALRRLNVSFVQKPTPSGPAVITLDLSTIRRLTDADLKQLASLSQLRELNLDSTQVTDEGLKTFGNFKELE